MGKINENYVYKEPEEITIQRNKIHKNQRNIEDFIITLYLIFDYPYKYYTFKLFEV